MLQVRGSNVNGSDGFLICGKDKQGRRLRIFVKHLSTALQIKQVLNNPRDDMENPNDLVDHLILDERQGGTDAEREL